MTCTETCGNGASTGGEAALSRQRLPQIRKAWQTARLASCAAAAGLTTRNIAVQASAGISTLQQAITTTVLESSASLKRNRRLQVSSEIIAELQNVYGDDVHVVVRQAARQAAKRSGAACRTYRGGYYWPCRASTSSKVQPKISPSMDIQMTSNFERHLY